MKTLSTPLTTSADSVVDSEYNEQTPQHSDEYNVWIGKCVSLAKALGKPIPDFIKNKNMED